MATFIDEGDEPLQEDEEYSSVEDEQEQSTLKRKLNLKILTKRTFLRSIRTNLLKTLFVCIKKPREPSASKGVKSGNFGGL
jgi:hypothetical protein